MAFIDELIGQGGLPYGMEIEEEPKAHDEIDSLIDNNLQKDLMNIVMGTVGGGGGKGLRQLMLALKGKIKGGKMIPSQPIRQGIVGGGKSKTTYDPSFFEKDIVDFSKKQLKKPNIDAISKKFGKDLGVGEDFFKNMMSNRAVKSAKEIPYQEVQRNPIDNILKQIEQRDPRYANYGRGEVATKEGASNLDNLLPFLLLSSVGDDMGGEPPNIGRTSKQY